MVRLNDVRANGTVSGMTSRMHGKDGAPSGVPTGATRGVIAAAVAVVALAAMAPAALANRDILRIAPKQIDFGTKRVGTENFSGVAVTNRSRSDILVLVTSALPDDFGFGLMPGSTCPALGADTLRARRSCRAVVRFSPTEYFAGLRQTGELIVTATDPKTGAVLDEEVVPIKARGALPWRRTHLHVSPHRLIFGRQAFGSFTKRTVTLTNKSSEALRVSIEAIAPDDFSPGQPESTCELSFTVNALQAGESCTHVVGFQPSPFFTGPQSAELIINVLGDGGGVLKTHRVEITGRGV
jgi:hypothetical protein